MHSTTMRNFSEVALYHSAPEPSTREVKVDTQYFTGLRCHILDRKPIATANLNPWPTTSTISFAGA
jgi:hypothetical protein